VKLGASAVLNECGSPALLAEWLVAQGILTPFQSSALLDGRGQRLVLGEYLLLDLIGVGGMGQVYKARHRRMDRVVALKVLAGEIVASSDAIKRFQREVRAAARLEHPHVVTA
jgi:eukaryotic-like serine/threonine-protein kinase